MSEPPEKLGAYRPCPLDPPSKGYPIEVSIIRGCGPRQFASRVLVRGRDFRPWLRPDALAAREEEDEIS